ncbi:unnamed protein product [Nyctereutes procyonoides]|uniref:(raccoon dog) hypothetical protein n=1 Tax=Nyctereutes procyonoides TaxID=34880 RepID=A0A811ZGQ1_NYCPR|nr:unnamed protein product [Nyctereutes procyonoides]
MSTGCYGGGVPDDLSLEDREELLDISQRKKEFIDGTERLKYEIAESKTAQRNKQIAMGRKKFNFLYKREGLNKTVIGDYLVLQVFVELREFADLNLVQASRPFLWSFRLPREAQEMDRRLEASASRYCLCNPGVFQSTDTCYVLSFANITLNTNLQPQSAPSLYENIRNEPFKIPEDDGSDLACTFFNPDHEGWLLKLGGRMTDKEPRGIVPLENLSIREVEDPRNRTGQVIKACKTEADGRVVEGNQVVYLISDMLATRKRRIANKK